MCSPVHRRERESDFDTAIELRASLRLVNQTCRQESRTADFLACRTGLLIALYRVQREREAVDYILTQSLVQPGNCRWLHLLGQYMRKIRCLTSRCRSR